MLKLNRAVFDAESACKYLANALADSFTFRSRHIENTNMAGQRVGAGIQTPDVDIMDVAHAFNLQHGVGDLLKGHSLGEAFEQNIHGFPNNADCAPHDHSRNQES